MRSTTSPARHAVCRLRPDDASPLSWQRRLACVRSVHSRKTSMGVVATFSHETDSGWLSAMPRANFATVSADAGATA